MSPHPEKKINAVILSNEQSNDHLNWIYACDLHKEQLEYRIVNLTLNNWLEAIQAQPFDVLLAKPGGITSLHKQLYDERIYILNKILGYFVFPSADEIFLYENKRFLSYWLKANKIPHPDTNVFYNVEETTNYINNCNYPIVAKTNIGASGRGVVILQSKSDASSYMQSIFNGSGAFQHVGPNFQKPNFFRRGLHYLFHPLHLLGLLRKYSSIKADAQRGFIILQAYIKHTYEWRVIRIGNSFFAHKKIIKNNKASGSLQKQYDNPPFELLDFVKDITDKFRFHSHAIDIFESSEGYLVNEMQCIFGQSDPYQMLVNNIPGRYLFDDHRWIFEEGDFNKYESYDLRVRYVIDCCISEK